MRMGLPWGALLMCFMCGLWPLSRRCIAAVCRGESSWLAFRLSAHGHNTVAAQRRILTAFPIYFLRLPAASRRLYALGNIQCGTQTI